MAQFFLLKTQQVIRVDLIWIVMRNRMVKSKISTVVGIALVLIPFFSNGQSGSTISSNISGSNISASKGIHLVSHQSENTIVSTILEASLGGEAGALIEKQMDKQARELKSSLKNAKVERLGEGILITMDSREIFDHDSFGLHKTRPLKELTTVLKKYQHTNVSIESHTNSNGEEVYNLSLSEQRAHKVEEFLWKDGIKSDRIKAKGYGATQPLTTINSDAAKAVNLRLEIAICASEEMKNLAMLGKIRDYTASNR